MRWYKTQMHLHASFEQYASMRSHAEMARQLGFDVLFITEHDVRMNHMPNGIEHFELNEPGDAIWPNGAGWRHPDGMPCMAVKEKDGVALQLEPGKEACFSSPGKKHQASLLAILTLKMALRVPAGQALRIDVALSLRPDQRQQHLYYEIGPCPGGEEDAWRIPIEGQGDFEVSLPLSEDVLRFDEFGQDNAFCSVALTTFGGGIALCRSFSVNRLHTAESVRQLQQRLADRIGADWGLRIYAANEISLSSGHRNSYSAFVPVIDYARTGFDLTTEQACAYVKGLGGTFSHNHPFEEWKRCAFTPEERAKKVAQLRDRLLASRAEGAQLIEVGFPEGRSGFTLAEHLRLWDELAMAGLPLTGYGDSDCHDSRTGWNSGNNFATWLYARSAEWTDLEEAMRAGRALMGDPARWHGHARFHVGGASMGERLVIVEKEEARLELDIDGLTEPTRCVIVSSGERISDLLCQCEQVSIRMAVCRGDRPIAPIRFELYALDGRCILLSNPVYLIQ